MRADELLPDDWYEEVDGQHLVLSQIKVATEIVRLNERVTELLRSNNEFEERARGSERALFQMQNAAIELSHHLGDLRLQLVDADSLIATHADKIDSNPRSMWPKGSALAAAIDRHAKRSGKGG